jgi:sortase A
VVIEATSTQTGADGTAEQPALDAAAGEEADGHVDAAEEASSADAPRATRSGPPAVRVGSVLLAVVMMASVAAVFFGAFAFGLSGLQEQRSQHVLYAELRGLLDPSSPVSPWIGGKIPAGAPVALLNAPKAGIRDTVVVEGTSAGDTLAGPGHQANTPLPGQAGNSVILGRAATAGAPFARVTDLRRGDIVSVRTGQGLFHYRVRGRLVNGGRLPTIRSTSGLLVLGTSAGSGTFASLSPSHVVFVYAQLIGKDVATPHHQPRHVATSELAGHNDPSAWPFVVLWLGALAAASAACWWLWSYWGLLRTWIIGAPVLFGILWALSNEAMRLLPNVY